MNKKNRLRILIKKCAFSGFFILVFFAFTYASAATLNSSSLLDAFRAYVVTLPPVSLPVVRVSTPVFGLPGSQGIQGPQGIQGIPGPQGERGPQGPAGTSSFASPELLAQAGFVSRTLFDNQVNGLLNSISNNIQGLSDSLGDEVRTDLLNVNGNATISGNLNVTGNILGSFNPNLTLGSIPFQGSSGLTENNANLFWDATNGRLGIGTNTPSSLFTIYGSNNSTNLATGGGIFASIVNADQTNGNFDSLSYRMINSTGGEVTGTRISGVFTSHTAGAESADLAFLTRNAGTVSEKMRILSSGNVGIGTSAPDVSLTVNANTGTLPSTLSGTNLHIVGLDAAGAGINIDSFGGAPTIFGRRADGTSTSPSAVLADESLLSLVARGYGTSAYSSNKGFIQIKAAGTWTDTAGGTYIIFDTTPAAGGTNTERVRIDDAGNVGIGTSTPNDKLEVNGNIRITSGSNGQVIFSDGSIMSSANVGSASSISSATDAVINGDSDNNGSGAIILKTGNTERWRMLNNGNIGVGTAAPTANLTFGGTGTSTINSFGGLSIKSDTTSNLTLDSGTTGNIAIGTSANTKNITIGNSTGTTVVSIDTGTGSSLKLGTNAIAHTVIVGGTTGASALTLDSGTGAINIGATIAKTVNIGNITGATAVNVKTGTGNFALNTSQLFVNQTTGNVGVGTATPAYKVDVNGALNATGLKINGVDVATSSDTFWTTATGGINYGGGNVGIGTSTPNSLFTIYGSNNSTNLATGGGIFASIVNADQTNGNFDSLSYRMINSTGGEVTGTRISGVFTSHTAGAESADLAFLTRNAGTVSEKMRILSSGNVGIGTSAPAYALDVNGAINATGLKINGVDVATSSDTFWSLATGGINYGGGNVGIGTTTPASLLTIAASDPTVRIGTPDSNSAKATLILEGASSSNNTISSEIKFNNKNEGTDATRASIRFYRDSTSQTGQLRFATATAGVLAERMTITSAGNVGIGTTTPLNPLTISPGTLASGINAVNVTATLSTATGAQTGSIFDITSNGPGGTGTSQTALRANLNAGYTGDKGTSAFIGVNVAAGTANDLSLNTSGNPVGNAGGRFNAQGVTTGLNFGSSGIAENGILNIGLLGKTTVATASATNIGVAGFAFNNAASPVEIGGYFGLNNSTPTFTSAALMADNGGTTDPIFVARDNGTSVFNIIDGGNVGIGTATPAYKLDVSGTINASGLKINGVDVATSSDTFWSAATGGIAYSSKVGIGNTTTPAGLLDVSGSSNSTTLTSFDGNRNLSIVNTDTTNNNASGLDFRTFDASNAISSGAKIMGVYTSHSTGAVSADLAFLTKNAGTMAEVMRINSAGDVIIGSGELSTPIAGTIRAPNASGTNIVGAALNITSGKGTGSGDSGAINITGANGSGTSSGSAGSVNITGGANNVNGSSGSINITGGRPSTGSGTGAGGAITIISGQGGTSNAVAGIVTIRAGTSNGTGNDSSLFLGTDNTNALELSSKTVFRPVTDNSVSLGDSTHSFSSIFLSGSTLHVDSSSNIGIGTATPGANLHVFKAAAGGIITPSTNAGIAIENNDDVSLQLFSPTNKSSMIQFGSSINGAQGRINYTNSSSATTDFMSFDVLATERLRIDVNGNVGVGTTTPLQALDLGVASASVEFSSTTGPHQIITAGATNLALMPGGNVGVGTTTPAYKVDVNGVLNATGLKINGVDVATSSDTFWTAATGGINYGAGNVGIGTSAPVSKLHIASAPTATANYGTVSIGSGAFDGATSGFFVGSANGTQIAVNSVSGFTGNLIDLQKAGSTKFLVTAAGNVGIGVSAPASPLDVQGDIRIHAGSGGRVVFADGSTLSTATSGSADALSNASDAIITGDSDASAAGDIIFKTGASEKMRIANAGSLTFSNGLTFGSQIAFGTGLGAITHILGPTDGPLLVKSVTNQSLTLDSGTTGDVNLGTGANAKAITIGNITGSTSLTLSSGSGAINIGTGGAKALTIGNTAGTTSLTLNAGTGTISIGTGSQARTTNIATGSAAQTVTLGSTSGASSLTLNAGTGALNIGTSIAKTITIGNTTGATALVLNTGSGNFALNTNQLLVNQASGVLKIAGTAVRATTEGTNHLDIFDGTAPVGTLANGISLYSTSGELRVMDAAGNATLLSPHDLTNNDWVYDSVNVGLGKDLLIQMEQMMKELNASMGWDYVHETIDGVPSAPRTPMINLAELNLNLNIIAGLDTALPGSDSESFVASFFDNVFGKITTWLADAGNGIGEVFTKKINTNTLCVSDDSGAETCITKSQLDALLINAGTSSSGGGSSGGSSAGDEESSGDTPSETCSDGIQNQDETSIDTGGVCAPTDTSPVPDETCSDGIKNQDETEIDAGGVCGSVDPAPEDVTPPGGDDTSSEPSP